MLERSLMRNLSAARLRWLLGLLFLGLAVPAVVLIRHGFAQLELEEFRRQQLIAEQIVGRIDRDLAAAIAVENARPVSDFEFSVAPLPGSNLVRLSPLSSVAAAGVFPGTIGYFQVDAAGQLSTPLLPELEQDWALDSNDFRVKAAVEQRVSEVLEANRLVDEQAKRTMAPEPFDLSFNDVRPAGVTPTLTTGVRGQRAFDELAGPPLELQGKLESPAEREETAEADAAAPARGDQYRASGRLGAASAAAPAGFSFASFSGEIEPLRFSRLATGHYVLFRNAWRDGERYVQGMLIDPLELVDESFKPVFATAGLAAGTRLGVAALGAEITRLETDAPAAGNDGEATALYSARLSPPLADIELSFAAGLLEPGPASSLLAWTAIALFTVLVGGFLAMYRFGTRQLELARQQQNFVSAVSHELKTPLTSIRMYGEMLKSGWADEEKKHSYYAFILDEGERLSRLIDNVLQLARLNKGGPDVVLEPIGIGELLDIMRSKLHTQTERAGFSLRFEVDPAARALAVEADSDALTQILINLVDNAIKFSAGATTKTIVIAARKLDNEQVVISVRDHGPGIPAAELKRLFELFYRPNNELTRTTAGTGIGLALVKQLAAAMGGKVDVRNCEPGAEFRLILRQAPRSN